MKKFEVSELEFEKIKTALYKLVLKKELDVSLEELETELEKLKNKEVKIKHEEDSHNVTSKE